MYIERGDNIAVPYIVRPVQEMSLNVKTYFHTKGSHQIVKLWLAMVERCTCIQGQMV